MDASQMEPGKSLWHELPLGVQQHILLLTGNPCARRVSKAWRNAFDAANDTLNCRTCGTPFQDCMPVARAAIGRLVNLSTSLTAISLGEASHCSSALLTLSDLTAAGAASGLPTRLRKLAVDVRADVPFQLLILQQYTSLTHLDISHTQYGPQLELGPVLGKPTAAALTEAFQNLHSLTYLRIQHLELKPEGITLVLQPLTQLQHLLLPGNELKQAGVAALAPALSATPGLQTLDVGINSLEGAEGAQALCAVLDVVPGLTHLDVSGNGLRRKGAALLAPVLQGMTCLQTLNMRYTWMGHRGMAKIAPALAALSHLHTLDVGWNDLRSGAMSALHPVLAREDSPLRELDLSHNCFGVGGGRALAGGLSASLQLQVLNLEATELGQEDWVALGPAMSRLGPTLLSLTLRSNSSQAGTAAVSVGMETVAPALMGMVRLQYLSLSDTPMHVEGTAAFAQALPAFASSLTYLNLSQCSIDAEAASRVLAPALAQATSLAELHLSHNVLGPQGAQWLVPVLATLPHLRTLGLVYCGLGVRGCMAIAQAVKERDGTVVRLFDQDFNSRSAEGIALLDMPGITVYV